MASVSDESSVRLKRRRCVRILAKKIKYKNIEGTYNIVIATVAALKNVIVTTKWDTLEELRNIIVANGKFLIAEFPMEESIGNMVRKILFIIKKTHSNLKRKATSGSENDLESGEMLDYEAVSSIDSEEVERSCIPLSILKSALIEDISDYQYELKISNEEIVNQAEALQNKEVVLTIGGSRLVERFLKEAAKTKPIRVIVAEGAPLLEGRQLAARLADANISTTLIPDTLIFAMMPEVSLVIIGANAVMGDGCVRAVVGSTAVAVAAQNFEKIVWVLLPLHKLSPRILSPDEKKVLNVPLSTESVYGGLYAELMKKITFCNSKYDYVPADLIDCIIANVGRSTKTCIDEFIRQIYNPDDVEL